MDILNFISWIKGGRVVTSVDPTKTLIPVGLKDSRRDDGYLAGAITVADLQLSSAYSSYTASIGQNDENDPYIIVEFENSLDVQATLLRDDIGIYIGTFDKPLFNSPRDYCVMQNPLYIEYGDGYVSYVIQVVPVFVDSIMITTTANGILSDNVMGAIFEGLGANPILDIRVYPNAIFVD